MATLNNDRFEGIMNDTPIIMEGVTLMLLGMGFVFCFLVLLVGATRLLSAISIKYAPPPPLTKKTSKLKAPEPSNDTVVAAISAALHHHKKKFS
jgi:oxaloacetate decarboxylase gamma subunit